MSTRNITPTLYRRLTDNTGGIEKKSARLLKDLTIPNYHTMRHRLFADTIKEMHHIANLSPRAASGAMSPTSMASFIANNKTSLPIYHNNFRQYVLGPKGELTMGPIGMGLGRTFVTKAQNKAYNAEVNAYKRLVAYMDKVNAGEVDVLNPNTLRRSTQLDNRWRKLLEARESIDRSLDALGAK